MVTPVMVSAHVGDRGRQGGWLSSGGDMQAGRACSACMLPALSSASALSAGAVQSYSIVHDPRAKNSCIEVPGSFVM